LRALKPAVVRQRCKNLFNPQFAMRLSHEITAAPIRPASIDGQPDPVTGKSG